VLVLEGTVFVPMGVGAWLDPKNPETPILGQSRRLTCGFIWTVFWGFLGFWPTPKSRFVRFVGPRQISVELTLETKPRKLTQKSYVVREGRGSERFG